MLLIAAMTCLSSSVMRVSSRNKSIRVVLIGTGALEPAERIDRHLFRIGFPPLDGADLEY
jgi:hypothetical protein